MRNAAAAKLLGRGVWVADYLLDGRPVLLAVDSRGELRKRVRLASDADEEFAREWLEGLLEHYDPPVMVPRLTLVPRSAAPDVVRFYLPRRSERC